MNSNDIKPASVTGMKISLTYKCKTVHLLPQTQKRLHLAQLVKKCRVIFPQLDKQKLSIQYFDDEGDQISIGTNSELQDALHMSKHNKSLKLFVKDAQITSSEQLSMVMPSVAMSNGSTFLSGHPALRNYILSSTDDAGTKLDDFYAQRMDGEWPPKSAKKRGIADTTMPALPIRKIAAMAKNSFSGNSMICPDRRTDWSFLHHDDDLDLSMQDMVSDSATNPGVPTLITSNDSSRTANSAQSHNAKKKSVPNGGAKTKGSPNIDDENVDTTSEQKGKTRASQPMTDEQRKVKKRERNRVNAKKSRMRKKFFVDSLKFTLEKMKIENEALRTELLALKSKYLRVKRPVSIGMHVRDPVIKCRSFVLTNPLLPDNPIVYASESFCKLTGYSRKEIMGKNCRFLQGLQTDTTAVATMQDAIRRGEDVTVRLVNYRKDGRPFWNENVISALRDSNGKITHYVGVQQELHSKEDLPYDDVLGGKAEFGNLGRVDTDIRVQRSQPAANRQRQLQNEFQSI